jgi:hypothetical protein
MVASAVTHRYLQLSHIRVRSEDRNRMHERALMHPLQEHLHLELASRPPHWHQSLATT